MPDADQAALIAQNPLDFRVDHTALGGLGLRKVQGQLPITDDRSLGLA
jgi:hypothetical protein